MAGTRRKVRKKSLPVTDSEHANTSHHSTSKPPSRGTTSKPSSKIRSAPQSTMQIPVTRSPSPTLNLINAEAGPSRLSSVGCDIPQMVSGHETSPANPQHKMRADDLGFNGQADFIPFELVAEAELSGVETTSIAKKLNRDERSTYLPRSPSRSPPRHESRLDTDRVRSKSPSRRRRERSRSPTWRSRDRSPPRNRRDDVREWNRGRPWRDDPSDGRVDSGKAPWAEGIEWSKCNNVAEMLHVEVEAFVDWVSPTPIEDEIRGLIVQQVTDIVCNAFPDASVLPFGSFATKLYLPLGDIDLVILSDSMAYSNKDTVLQSLAHVLRKAAITDRVTIVAKAKVPIIKFITTHGRFNVDISINQANGVVSGQIINGFLRDMHSGGIALRALVLIAKAFLSQRSMNEVYTGGLGSYSIVCLAVSFLQMHPKIRRAEIEAEKNLGVLVMEFFELYGYYFNYGEVGISVRDGGTYFSKRARGWLNFNRNNSPMLSIEDPVEHTNDISSGSYGFHRVRQSLAGAYNILRATSYQRAEWLRSCKNGTLHPLSPDTPEKMSILWKVMGITQETINHRRLVEELHKSRTLHRLLGIQPKVAVVEMTNANGKTEAALSGSESHSRHVQSVRSAWAQADRAVSDDEKASATENGHTRGTVSRRAPHDDDDDDDDDEEDQGRYRIGRDPPRKRRRMGGEQDQHIVYFVDEDDASSLNEQLAYASPSSSIVENHLAEVSKPSSSSKRSYWLSKALEVGQGSDEGFSS